MRRISRSPSYLVRTPYSYCFRLNVPRDLQKFVGKTEMRYSLATGYVGLAKSKARLLAGHVQEFFRRLREIIQLGELTDNQIVDLVNRYFRNFINGLEKIRTEPGAYGKGDVFDKFNQINQSVCKRAKDALAECEYSSAWPHVTAVLEKEGLKVQLLSATHNKICREMLKGMIRFGAIEKRRREGDYSDDIEAAFPLSTDRKPDQMPPMIPEKKPSIPFFDVIEEYKKRKVQSKEWRPSVERNHRPRIRTFKQVLGNRPVNHIRVDDIRKLAKLLELLPPFFARMKEYKDICRLRILKAGMKKPWIHPHKETICSLRDQSLPMQRTVSTLKKTQWLRGLFLPRRKLPED